MTDIDTEADWDSVVCVMTQTRAELLKHSAKCLKGLVVCFETNTRPSFLIDGHFGNFRTFDLWKQPTYIDL